MSTKAKEIRVRATQGIWGDGYACDHSVAGPKKTSDVVLCQSCSDAVTKGAKIVKMAGNGKLDFGR